MKHLGTALLLLVGVCLGYFSVAPLLKHSPESSIKETSALKDRAWYGLYHAEFNVEYYRRLKEKIVAQNDEEGLRDKGNVDGKPVWGPKHMERFKPVWHLEGKWESIRDRYLEIYKSDELPTNRELDKLYFEVSELERTETEGSVDVELAHKAQGAVNKKYGISESLEYVR